MAPVLVLAEHHVDAIVVDGIGGRPLMGFNQVGIVAHAGLGSDVQASVDAAKAARVPWRRRLSEYPLGYILRTKCGSFWAQPLPRILLDKEDDGLWR